MFKDKYKIWIISVLIFLTAFLLFFVRSAFAQAEIARKGVAVFAVPGNNSTDNILTAESVDSINKVFSDCGRFIPAGAREIDAALNREMKESGALSRELYSKAASLLRLDIYVMVTVRQFGGVIYSDMEVISLRDEYRRMEKKIRLRSRVKLNMPLKISREIAVLHRNIPVYARIIEAYGDSLYLIDAGEWHGLYDRENYRLQDAQMQTVQTGRYKSIVRIPGYGREIRGKVVIDIYPDTDKIINELDDSISINTISMYGLEIQGHDTPEKRLLQGICVINMGGNLCLPGYGAFLSTGYLGIKDAKPDMTGVTLSATASVLHFVLPELMTGFNINFFPWKQDSDKTDSMQNMQKFLWASIPFTFSVAYLDQLAYQFRVRENVPPFFSDRDSAAAIFSFFIPGGGLFYKGHRFAGWSFYLTEMLTAGYGIYNYDDKPGKYALCALGAIKLLDIVYAYIVTPSYPFFNLEHESNIAPVTINMGMRKGSNDENVYNVMVTANL